MSSNSSVALVLEGGGFRGMFTAGVLEVLLREQIFFQEVIGVSAGAAYGVSYVSRQPGRNLVVNRFVNHPQYCGWKHLFKHGSYFNWEFIYRTIPTQLLPFDYQAFARSSSRMTVVVSNIDTGLPEYHRVTGSSFEEFRDWLTATSSLPIISPPKCIDGSRYMDGGLLDSIPVSQALGNGQSRAVVVLTRPKGYRKRPPRFPALVRRCCRNYPLVADMLLNRARRYNQAVDQLEALEQAGTVFVIRPTFTMTVSRLDNHPRHLEALYHQAMEQMQKELPRLREWLGNC
ncbi:putative patatin/cPLA2 family phospholipase [Breznakibacter xylanolyticus]|uniref:Putative patatin/cPLA2 family phospholipase n=1 Tax=Breznakibacter xylanolyticus TaxID=990 RepID=A0A2W7N6C1_9BACT|nr:patatin family protein [Breznakibacter xylanolyticus]PZX12404.1 putative patatin/cPLA2 family phospholipase [Breznakibacter xylanolyticus]